MTMLLLMVKEMTSKQIEEHKAYLRSNGYENVVVVNDTKWYATFKFMFTHAIISGKVGDMHSYDDRWCFHSEIGAISALAEMIQEGFENEPKGWHRHLPSGRRLNEDTGEYYVRH